MKNNLSNIKKAIEYLNKNQCIGIPTETVYGLAANAYSSIATNKIFKLKKRPKNNPLIVHYYNIKLLKNDCEINDLFLKLYKKYSPGPISYILKLKKNSLISKNVTNKKKNFSSKISKSSYNKEFIKKIKLSISSTKCKYFNKN